GSTGQPKGVCIDHRSVVNTIIATIDEFELGPGSRVLQFASIAFDASVWEIWSALLAGATLYLATQAELMPGEELARFTSAHAITHLVLMPNALSIMPAGSLETVDTLA